MKKLLCVMIVLFSVSAVSHAIEVSVGGSLGGGIAFLRGDNADTMPDSDEAFAMQIQANVMLQFMPFLALETGVGYGGSEINYSTSTLGINTKITLARAQVYIPLLVRGQYEYDLGVTYASAGVKLNIPIMEDFWKVKVGDATATTLLGKAPFIVDIAFAVGQEFKLGTVVIY